MNLYLNGKIVKEDSNQEILEPGFLFGWGVFETLRIYSGEPAFLKEHIQRLKQGCNKISLSFPDINFQKQIQILLNKNKLSNAYCRITVFKKRNSPGVIIYVSPFTYYGEEEYKKGYKAVVSSFIRNSKNLLVGVKSINYLENRLAWKIAQDRGKDEAIFLNEYGFLSEGSRTNIFFVRGNVIYTPSLNCGMLVGITRQKVIKVIKENRLVLKEGRFKIKDLLSCDEAFLTSSLMEVMPLVEINNRVINKGRPGSIAYQVRVWYKNLVLRHRCA
jgi:branched-subunit amino acid aminotransferase/4-amino-4-deoxychorismate lyase